MKPAVLLCSVMFAVLFTSCNGAHGYDLHKTLALVIIIAIIVLFLALAIFSNMLRDEVNDCNAFNAEAAKITHTRKLKNPYSLSRVQLAIWTVIIASSYIYLQLCKGNCDITDVNQTALILMGIGAGVTTAGSLMDNREIQEGVARHQNAPSQGFLMDILSDENGISIHRFQSVIWTGIAMIVYLTKVYGIKTGCALPELSGTLLALTGISSATYLAIKTQENANPAPGSGGNGPGGNGPGGNGGGGNTPGANVPAGGAPVTTQPVQTPAAPVVTQAPVVTPSPAAGGVNPA